LSPLLVTLIGVGAFLILALLGLPVAISLAFTGFIGTALLVGFEPALTFLGKVPFVWAIVTFNIPIALFMLMATFVIRSGIGEELYEAAHKWVGQLPGGLAIGTNLACTGFAGCAGMSLPAIATMGMLAIPEMERYNYSRGFACGCVAAGGTLGVLIPPSIVFIIYGFLSETSIGDLFIAGLLPGLLISLLFSLMIFVMCKINPALGPAGKSYTWRERFVSLKGVWGMLFLFLLVILGLYFGIFSPSEAAAIGAFGAFVICLARRRLTKSNLTSALTDSLRITGFMVTLVIGAQLLTTFLAVAGLPSMVAGLINSINVPPLLILTMILILYLFLGLILDPATITLVTIPVVVPALTLLGFDLIWFGVLFTVMTMIGGCTPPVGLDVYTLHAITKVPLSDIFRGAIPFVLVMIVGAALLVAFPQISLFLPNLMK
jgi:C4-dicarboxylate transporter DctM subunit